MSEHDEILADNWAQFVHEAHMTMRYSLRDLANGDTGHLDPADCPVCTPAPRQGGGRTMSAPAAIIDASLDDTWTCDHWQVHGVWTTKAYAMHGTLYRWAGRELRGSYVGGGAPSPRSRRACAAVNYVWQTYCQRCGFPQPEPKP